MHNIVSRTFSRLSATKPVLDDNDREQAVNAVVTDGIWATGMVTLQGGPFLIAFALAMGAGNYEIGLITTIVFCSQLMQLPGLALVNAFKKRKALIVCFASISRLMWLFIIAMPLLFIDRGVSFMLQWLLIASLVGALIGPAWSSLLRDVLPADRLGAVLSRRMMLGTIVGAVLTLAGGAFIDFWATHIPNQPNVAYSVLFAIGLVFGLLGVSTISRIPEPKMHVDNSGSLWEQLVQPLRDENFRNLLVFLAIWNFSFCLAAPFFIVYMRTRIGFSVFLVTIMTVVAQLASVFCVGIWGKLADRFSHKSVLSASSYLYLLAVVAWCFTTLPEPHAFTIPLVVIIHILSGASIAGIGLATTNVSLKLSPPKQAHAYMTAFALVGAVAGMVAPMFSGVLADICVAWQLGIKIDWETPTRGADLYAVNIKALDFVFLLSFLVGWIARGRLARVIERGEVDDSKVLDELAVELIMPLRAVSSVIGTRRTRFLPVQLYTKLKLFVSSTSPGE